MTTKLLPMGFPGSPGAGNLPASAGDSGSVPLLSCGIIPNWGKDPIGIRPDTYPWELGGAGDLKKSLF